MTKGIEKAAAVYAKRRAEFERVAESHSRIEMHYGWAEQAMCQAALRLADLVARHLNAKPKTAKESAK